MTRFGRGAALWALGVLVGAWVDSTSAGDWPQWRSDAGRSAATPDPLPAGLRLAWTRALPPQEPAWPDQPKMVYDAVHEPIVVGERLVVGSSRDDALTAYDTRTGEVAWRFQTDGPLRLAPAGDRDAVYCASDDGQLYCLGAAEGELRWKFRGGPSERRVLGNERLISAWPARGGPVVVGGTVYFCAGIWPFMGVFMHAVDGRSGKPVWTNDGDGSLYMKQPHSTDSFAGVAPQGPLAAIGDHLLIPGGRSVPAVYDRRQGKLLYYLLNENGKRGGGSAVHVTVKVYFNGGAAFDLATGKYLGPATELLASSAQLLVGVSSGQLSTYDLGEAGPQLVDTVDMRGKPVKEVRWTAERVGRTPAPRATALILAGTSAYVGGDGFVEAIELPLGDETPAAGRWRGEVQGQVTSLLAADERLFAVTDDGLLHAFAAEAEAAVSHRLPAARDARLDDRLREPLAELRTLTDVREGYAFVWGLEDGSWLEALGRETELRLIGLDDDAARVAAVRERLRALDWSAKKACVVRGPLESFAAPPYLASLIVCERCPESLAENPQAVRRLFETLRPFGGAACLPLSGPRQEAFLALVKSLELPQARISTSAGWVCLTRDGALPGSGNWTHEHADAANTRVSRDALVKAPLGLLWFGGTSHEGILPRHGHGPQPQVIDGRLIIEGMDLLRAIDIYTGRLLWEAALPGIGEAFSNTAHQPGANAIGTNYISAADGVYVAYGRHCLVLDPATGKTLKKFGFPPAPQTGQATTWSYLNVVGDLLLGGGEPLLNPEAPKPVVLPAGVSDSTAVGALKDLLKKLSSSKGTDDTGTGSKRLVAMNRHTGEPLWTITARETFRHNAICAGGGRLYAIDRLSGAQVSRFKRRGEEPTNGPLLRCFDLADGKELWSIEAAAYGSWLSYSAERDILIEAGRVARDTLSDEAAGMRALRAATGEVIWTEKHAGPAMIRGDRILLAGTGCDLLTGKITQRECPLTGEKIPWTWMRNYGCNTPMGSEHLLTFRSGAAGYFDLAGDGGTGNFGGFRSSCTNNLVAAGGLLVAPDYTRTCTCSYQNQTSVGLVPMPEAETWTSFGSLTPKGPIRRLGLNFAAPGDRRGPDGMLWLDAPSQGGPSPAVGVKTDVAKPIVFRRHESLVGGAGPAWVQGSGLIGVKQVEVTLGKPEEAVERLYTVRLYFCEPQANVAPGQRVFSVEVQDQRIEAALDVTDEAGGALKGILREISGVRVRDKLVVKLLPTPGARVQDPVLSGLELRAEGW